MKTKPKKTAQQIVVEKIITKINDDKILPWQCHWNNGAPQNYMTKRPYKGINRFICSLFFQERNFLSYKQITKLGGNLRKGSSGVPILYYNIQEKENDKGEVKRIPFARYTTVFNEKDIEGIDFPETAKNQNNAKIKQCEDLITKHNPKLIPGSPAYSPREDHISMPNIDTFTSSDEYYHTFFHEIAHWTGHHTRLNRKQSMYHEYKKGYGFEEMIAEFSSSIISSEMQLKNDINNSAGYIQNWKKAIQANPNDVIRAASTAFKVSEYLL